MNATKKCYGCVTFPWTVCIRVRRVFVMSTFFIFLPQERTKRLVPYALAWHSLLLSRSLYSVHRFSFSDGWIRALLGLLEVVPLHKQFKLAAVTSKCILSANIAIRSDMDISGSVSSFMLINETFTSKSACGHSVNIFSGVLALLDMSNDAKPMSWTRSLVSKVDLFSFLRSFVDFQFRSISRLFRFAMLV